MKRKVSNFKTHNFCNTHNSEAATRCSTKNTYTKATAPESLCNKFVGRQACNFIKKRREKQAPPAYSEIPKNTHSEEHLRTAASDN